MKRLFFALLAVALAVGLIWKREALRFHLFDPGASYASAQRGDVAKPAFNYSVQPGGNGRLYLIHGINRAPEHWREAPFNGLVQQGYEVVFIHLPPADPAFFNDGGKAYCAAFTQWLDNLDMRLDTERGRQPRKFIAGISYGGLHAMTAARRLAWVDAYAALSPAVYLRNLSSLRFQSNSECSPLLDPPSTPGIVAWSSDDEVGADLMQLAAIRANASAVPASGIGHTTSTEQMGRVIEFLSAQHP